MSKLGYTWYSQNWRASNTFRRLKKFPLVRYALRELFDLMYEEGAPIDMNREYLEDDFNIGLTDNDFNKLMEYIVVTDKGWWSDTVSIRLSKAEAARENGKKGGRPRKQNKTQKPRSETQEIIPKNPSLETKGKVKEKKK